MESKITEMVQHMARSQRELARILKAKKDVTAHAARLTISVRNDLPLHEEAGHREVAEQSIGLNKNLVAYLNALAGLEEALSNNLGIVMKELNVREDE